MTANIFKYYCPLCSFHLTKYDVRAERYEHDQEFHPWYFAHQTRLLN